MLLKPSVERVGMMLRMQICVVRAMWFKPNAEQQGGMMLHIKGARTMLLKPHVELRGGIIL
jgi:hypothetical protein